MNNKYPLMLLMLLVFCITITASLFSVKRILEVHELKRTPKKKQINKFIKTDSLVLIYTYRAFNLLA